MILRGETKLRPLIRDLLVVGCDAHELRVITSMTYLANEYNIFIEMLTRQRVRRVYRRIK